MHEIIHDIIVIALLAIAMVLCVGVIVVAATDKPHGCSGSCGIPWTKQTWGRGLA